MNLDFLEEIWAKSKITHTKVLEICVVVFPNLFHCLFHLLFEFDRRTFTFQGEFFIVQLHNDIFNNRDFAMNNVTKYQIPSQESSKKQKGKNGGKKEKRLLCTYLCFLHWSRMPSSYHPCAILPKKNPFIWKPPLQEKKIWI